MTERMTRRKGARALRSSGRRLAGLVVLGAALAAIFAVAALALVSDTNQPPSCDIQVANKNGTAVCTTTAGAVVRYLGDSNTTFGSSGTGTFNPFVRLQASPTEDGYNTDGTTEFDTKVGTWTHAILVSEIPVRTVDGCSSCWELFVDINDSNNNKVISLNDMEIWFTENADLTGYPFASGATKEYDFDGTILINDVNQGSGRGDVRYMVPRTGIAVPPNCNYGNPNCETYFLLYSEWGTTSGFPSDGGFEEWKVKVYPPAVGTTATSTQDWLPNDTATITSAGGQALNGTLTIQLYTEGTCGVSSGSAVSGQLYTFPLVNEASGTSHTTSNTAHLVTASSTVSWLVTFTSSDPNTIESSSHCESTALTITN
jgi:hypothetical protein